MMRTLASAIALMALVSLLAAGCSGSTPAAPAQSPAAKATEPAKQAAPTAAPTAAPKAAEPTAVPAAKKTDFPVKGKAIQLIIGYAAGGGADIGARVLAAPLQKELGTPVEVVNKPGAGTQISTAFVAAARPDGYTVGYSNFPNMMTVYLDPERKATYGRKDLMPVALHLADPMAIAVKADSPIKDFKGLLDAARASSGNVKIGTTGMLAIEHLVFLKLQQETGVKFSFVHFEGTAPGVTALVGGHIDAIGGGFSSLLPTAKGGQSRILASMDKGGDAFLPGTPSLESLGYKGYFGVTRGWFVPTGTPKEIVDILSSSIKKAMESEEHKAKMGEIGQMPRYLGPEEFGKYWDEMDTWVKPLMEMAAKDK